MQFWAMGFGLGPRDLVGVAQDAEKAGFDGLVLSDQLLGDTGNGGWQ